MALILILGSLLLLPAEASNSISFACAAYNSSACGGGGTNFAGVNYGGCHFSACGGDEVTINVHDRVGKTFLRVYDSSGVELTHHHANYWDNENIFNHTEVLLALPKSMSCAQYESRIGCYNNTDCSANTTVIVTSMQMDYVNEITEVPEGNTWNVTCPAFNVSVPVPFTESNSTVNGTEFVRNETATAMFDPAHTARCSYELCPGEYFRAFIRDCTHSATVSLFSYTDVGYTKYNITCEYNKDKNSVRSLFFDTTGHDECRMFSFYQFCDSSNTAEWCSGQVALTKHTYPEVNISWHQNVSEANPSHIVGVGDNLVFDMSDMNINGDYWQSGEARFWTVVYKTDMLEHQEHCGYRDVGHGNFYDYIDKFEWSLKGGVYTVRNNTGGNYTVGRFGGNYTVALYAWNNGNYAASQLAVSPTLTAVAQASMAVSLHDYGLNEEGDSLFSASWRFVNDACAVGDVVVVVPIDHRGDCNVHSQRGTYDSAIYQHRMNIDCVGKTFGVFDFKIPHCSMFSDYESRYEVHYVRDFEVIGRVLVSNESVVSGVGGVGDGGSESHIDVFGALDSKHTMHIFGLIVIVGVVSILVVSVFNKKEDVVSGYGGVSNVSTHDDIQAPWNGANADALWDSIRNGMSNQSDA